MNRSATVAGLCCLNFLLTGNATGAGLTERLTAAHTDFLEDRREILSSLSDPFGIPEAARVVLEEPSDEFRRESPWKRNVIATVFWVGEQPTENNPTPNDKSAWDPNWQSNYGGYDDPNARVVSIPPVSFPH